MASSLSRSASSWVVAASVGAVETMKDQAGWCRWNYVMRSLQQGAKNNVGSLSQANKGRMPAVVNSIDHRLRKEEKAKQSEESLRTVMYLSCWGPN